MISCSDSLALNEEDLLRYILEDEILSEDRRHHLEQCLLCQQRLLCYQDMHNMLATELYRIACPDAMELSLYAGNMLSTSRMKQLARHISICLLCTEEVSMVQGDLADLAPETARERFSPITLLTKARPWITAVLVPQAQIALRRTRTSATASWPRYYQSPAINLSLHLSYTNEHQRMLIGIVLDDDEEQIRIYNGTTVNLYLLKDQNVSLETLVTGDMTEPPLFTTEVDQQGQFSFTPLQEGHYGLLLRLPEAELFVEQIILS